jgi:hypothetical protein
MTTYVDCTFCGEEVEERHITTIIGAVITCSSCEMFQRAFADSAEKSTSPQMSSYVWIKASTTSSSWVNSPTRC